MITAEEFKKRLHTKMTEEEALECYELLEEDTKGSCILLPNLYQFAITTKHLGVKRHLERLHTVCVRYLANIDYSKSYFQSLYFLEMHYYYSIRIFSQSIHYANLLLDLTSAGINYKLAAINYVLTMLISQQLHKDAYQYIDLIESILQDYELKPEEKATYYINICDVYAQARDFKRYNQTLPLLLESISQINNKESKRQIIYCKDIHTLYQQSTLKTLSIEEQTKMALDVEKVMSDLENQTVFGDEYSTIFIPIFKAIKNSVEMKKMVEYVSKLLALELSVANEIDLFNFLVLEYNFKKEDDIKLFERYHQALVKNYIDTKLNHIHDIKAELESHEMRQAYALMKDKYQIDPLTGCYNRGYLLEDENRILKRNTIIAYIDINSLKFVNDNYGHHLGDVLITKFSHLILQNLPIHSEAIRYGGDEFVLIFNEKTKDEVISFLSNIYEECSKIKNLEGYDINIGFSSGLYISDGKTTLKKAVQKADEAMYDAKHNFTKLSIY